jgi:hypothetical protein
MHYNTVLARKTHKTHDTRHTRHNRQDPRQHHGWIFKLHIRSIDTRATLQQGFIEPHIGTRGDMKKMKNELNQPSLSSMVPLVHNLG